MVTTSQTGTSDAAERVEGEAELTLDALVEAVSIGVVQLHVEGLETAKDRKADATCRDRSYGHALDVIGALNAVGDVPAPVDDPPVGREVVAHERQDHHHHVLGHADAVRVRHLGDGDAPVDRRLQVHVVGADARGDRELEARRARDPLRGEVGRPEGLGDHDVGVEKLTFERAARSVLVGGNDEGVAEPLEVGAQTELPGDAAKELARLEVDVVRRGGRLAIGVPRDRGDPFSRIRGGIAVDRVFVEDANDLRHGAPRSMVP